MVKRSVVELAAHEKPTLGIDAADVTRRTSEDATVSRSVIAKKPIVSNI